MTARVYGFIAWLLAALFFLYEFFLRTFPGNISVALVHDFRLTPEKLVLVSSAYYLAYTLMQIPYGYLMGQLGVKKVIVGALAACILGNILFCISSNYDVLLTARFLMGLGSAAAFPSILIIARENFHQRHYGFLAGTTQVLGVLGPLLAGLPLVYAINYLNNNWRAPILLFALFGLAILIFIIVSMRTVKLDRERQTSVRHICEQVCQLIKFKRVKAVMLFALMSYASIPLFGAVWGALYLQSMGITRMHAVSIVSLIWVGLAVGSPLIGWVSDLLGNRRKVLQFCCLIGLLVSLTIVTVPIKSIFFLSCLFFLLGFSGASQTLSFVVLADILPEKLYPCAVGLNNAAVMLGGVIVPMIVGYMVGPFNGSDIHLHTLSFSLKLSLGIAPILYVLSFLTVGAAIPTTLKRQCQKTRVYKIICQN